MNECVNQWVLVRKCPYVASCKYCRRSKVILGLFQLASVARAESRFLFVFIKDMLEIEALTSLCGKKR